MAFSTQLFGVKSLRWTWLQVGVILCWNCRRGEEVGAVSEAGPAKSMVHCGAHWGGCTPPLGCSTVPTFTRPHAAPPFYFSSSMSFALDDTMAYPYVPGRHLGIILNFSCSITVYSIGYQALSALSHEEPWILLCLYSHCFLRRSHFLFPLNYWNVLHLSAGLQIWNPLSLPHFDVYSTLLWRSYF